MNENKFSSEYLNKEKEEEVDERTEKRDRPKFVIHDDLKENKPSVDELREKNEDEDLERIAEVRSRIEGGEKKEVEAKSAELKENAKEILYEAVSEMYKYVMFEGIPKWVGYNAGVGFDVKGLNFFEPPLQKLLSLIHSKKDEMSDAEYMSLIIHSVSVLRNFDYQQSILSEYQEEFRESGSLEIIDRVVSRFEEAIELARK